MREPWGFRVPGRLCGGTTQVHLDWLFAIDAGSS
jgi:hypothetical protein